MCSVTPQSCPTLCSPLDYNPPDSSVHGIFQAGVLEWGAIAFSGTLKAEHQEEGGDIGKEIQKFA